MRKMFRLKTQSPILYEIINGLRIGIITLISIFGITFSTYSFFNWIKNGEIKAKTEFKEMVLKNLLTEDISQYQRDSDIELARMLMKDSIDDETRVIFGYKIKDPKKLANYKTSMEEQRILYDEFNKNYDVNKFMDVDRIGENSWWDNNKYKYKKFLNE